MRPGHRALALLAAAGLLASAHFPSLAQTPAQAPASEAPAGEAAAQKPGSRQQAPAKPGADAQKQDDAGAQKPAEGSAQKQGEDTFGRPQLVSILGREVTNRDGDSGRIIDVLVDADGRSGAVVVEFGGFMGIGSRKVAVDWGALRFVRDGNRSSLIVDIHRDQIRDAPEYKPNEPPTVLNKK